MILQGFQQGLGTLGTHKLRPEKNTYLTIKHLEFPGRLCSARTMIFVTTFV